MQTCTKKNIPTAQLIKLTGLHAENDNSRRQNPGRILAAELGIQTVTAVSSGTSVRCHNRRV